MAALRAGIATVDITPSDFPGIRLGGFGFNRRATGVLHPLEAGVLYLRKDDGDGTGSQEVALVTVDSVGLMRPTVEAIRARVTRLSDRSRVLVCSTHSHATPDTLGYWGVSLLGLLPLRSGIEPRYVAQLAERVAAAVDEAAHKAEAATLHSTTFELDPTLFTNHRDKGARDNRGVLLRVDDAEGRVVGTLLNFAAHPEGLWERNRRVSPDYPHFARKVLRERLGGTPLFFNGALGGMLTPDIPVKARTPEREAGIERIGTALGEAAAQAAERAAPIDVPALRVVRSVLRLPVRNWRFRLVRRLGVLRRDDLNQEVPTEMTLVEAGELRLLTVPGEALPELGAELRDILGRGPGSFLLCLGCDELGYILPPTQFRDRHYRYEVSMSLGPETGPKVVRAAKELVERVSTGGGAR